MNVLITGAFGFLGRRLTTKLLEIGELKDRSGKPQEIRRIVLSDLACDPSCLPKDPRLVMQPGDLGNAGFVDSLLSRDTDSVFHLGSLVSGGAEKDFAAGLQANFLGTWHVLDACRKAGADHPRLVFTSSVAAYGGVLPETVQDTQRLTPQSSYGTHKAIGELLIADYSRKGYIDGRSVRLPIIAVRPGKANTATSSWASAIIREPLSGENYACPVAPGDKGFILSPRQVILGLIQAHDTHADLWGDDRAVMVAGLTCSAQDLAQALARVAGETVAARILWQPDAFIRDIVNSWPNAFSLEKATRIGFNPDSSIDRIIEDYITESQSKA